MYLLIGCCFSDRREFTRTGKSTCPDGIRLVSRRHPLPYVFHAIGGIWRGLGSNPVIRDVHDGTLDGIRKADVGEGSVRPRLDEGLWRARGFRRWRNVFFPLFRLTDRYRSSNTAGHRWRRAGRRHSWERFRTFLPLGWFHLLNRKGFRSFRWRSTNYRDRPSI